MNKKNKNNKKINKSTDKKKNFINKNINKNSNIQNIEDIYLNSSDNKKNKKNRKNRKNSIKNKRKDLIQKNINQIIIKSQNIRIIIILIFFIIFFMIITARMAYLQLVIGKELESKASEHQMIDKIISANRGNILDRNGEILAQSISVDTISINPNILRENNLDLNKEEFAIKIAEIFKLEKEDILKKVNSENSYEPIIEKQEKEKVDKLKEYIKEKEIIGVNIDPDFKRHYPYGKLAANIIGFCGTDNFGLEGLELELNDILVGKKGKLKLIPSVYNAQNSGQNISAEDGSNVYLTIDIKIQQILEKYLTESHKYYSNDASIAIAMNPQTSEILGMVSLPTYDLNNPFKPIDIKENEWNKLSYEKKQNIQQKMWRNTAITDGYEPRFGI